jgi:MFS family permease
MTLTTVLLPLLLLRSGGRRAVARVVPDGQNTSDSLFTRKYRLRTLFLCTAQVAALTAAYLLTSWLPTIVANVTGSLPQASLFNSLIYVGAIVGVVSMAAVVVRVGALRLLTGVYFVSALAALVVHFSMQNPGPKLVVALLGLGTLMLGGQMVLNTLAASLYPLELRARGLGLATGVGRIGALLGPAIGAALLASPHQKGQVFLYLCGIVVVTAATILAMLLVTRKDEAEHE